MSKFGNSFFVLEVILGAVFFAALFDSPISVHEKVLLGAALIWLLSNMTMRAIENLNLHLLNNKLLLSLFDVLESQEGEVNQGKAKGILGECINRVEMESKLGYAWAGHEQLYFFLLAAWIGLGALLAAFI